MLITTEVTGKDYRALQWSVLINRSKLHLGAIACLSVAALLLSISPVAVDSATFAARVIALILGGVGLLLLAIIAGAYFSRNKPLGDKRVPLGPHTYEVNDKSISATSDQRCMEFPVSALQCVTVTQEHFFVVPRQGTELIIPRRDLNAQQTEALLAFGEAVAFASLQTEQLKGEDMTPEKVALSFAIMRWSSLAMIVALPFTFGHGSIRAGSLVWPGVLGVLFLGCSLLGWRFRKGIWLSCAFCLVVVAGPLARRWEGPRHDWAIYQWALVLFVVAGLPLLLFPRFFRRLARIPEAAASIQQNTSAS